MRNTKFDGVLHHGWFVEVVPHNNKFSFRCYHPDLEGFQNDGTTQPTYQAALKAGCYFIDREFAIATLLQVLEELMSDQKISIEEYWNLANFC